MTIEDYFIDEVNKIKAYHEGGYDELLDSLSTAHGMISQNLNEENQIIAQAAKIIERAIPRLLSLIKMYPELRETAVGYIDTLREFSERNSQLQPVYEAYEKAFGVTGGEA